MPSPDLEQQLAELRRDYTARLPGRIADLRTRAAVLVARWDPSDADELRRLLHNLAGSGASYGFPALSDGARTAERALDALLAPGPAPAGAALAPLLEALAALDAAGAAPR